MEQIPPAANRERPRRPEPIEFAPQSWQFFDVLKCSDLFDELNGFLPGIRDSWTSGESLAVGAPVFRTRDRPRQTMQIPDWTNGGDESHSAFRSLDPDVHVVCSQQIANLIQEVLARLFRGTRFDLCMIWLPRLEIFWVVWRSSSA
jgi:hypothetical protein